MNVLHTAVREALAGVGPGLYGVACSGGADSMALAHAAIEVAGAAHVVVITIDHGLSRGSAEVAAAVADWARSRGAAAIVRAVTVERRASIEGAAREARYAAFRAIAQEVGLSALLVAHTARDQAETVLMRILRGTGPAGLAAIPATRSTRTALTARRDPSAGVDRSSPPAPGMPSTRAGYAGVPLLRPLLAIDRAFIDEYVEWHSLPVWDDPMNADMSLLRVRVRRDILPALRRENPQLDAALVRLAASTGEWLAVIDSLAAPFGRFPIDCAALATQPPAIRKRAVALALEALGFGWETSHLDAIDEVVCRAPAGEVAIDLPGGRFVRSYDAARFEPSDRAAADQGSPIDLPPGCELRTWREGDRMRPARLKGRSRKLSDLFSDAKVPRSQRAAARMVVRQADGTIVWAEHVGIAHDSVLLDGEREKLAAIPARSGGSF